MMTAPYSGSGSGSSQRDKRTPFCDGLSRRRFLKHAAGLGLAAPGFPTLVSAAVLGREGKASPSEQIVMGCIGLGGQGTRGMGGGIWVQGAGGFLGRKEIHVTAVCDVNKLRRDNARDIVNSRYGNKDCATYERFEELLARPDIDALLIATGERWHPLISIAAAEAGKDIYCEKPMSLTIIEALVLRSVIRRCGVIYQNGTQQRSSHAFRFACELVRNGYIGQVKEVVVGVGGPVGSKECDLPAEPVPDYLDYDRWLGQVPWRPYNAQYVAGWMGYRDCSGGEMTNWGAHHFDCAQWGLGMDNSGPVEIIPPDGKDYKVLTYHYANGVTMTRDPERLQRESGQNNGLMFVGTEGKVAVWRYRLQTWPDHLARQKIGPGQIHLHKSEDHHDDFIHSILTRTRPGGDVAVGARSITVCHLGNIAYELDRPVRWNPDTEQFVNDPEAARLMSRHMRSPWHL